MADFYLASHSRRRSELLHQVGARFQTLLLRSAGPRGADVGEELAAGEPAADYVVRVARQKAEHGRRTLTARALPPRPVLGADTVVILDQTILGKPRDVPEAIDFLARLSGRTHEVRTALALALAPSPPPVADGSDGVWTAVSRSQVSMRALTAAEIRNYVASGEAFDKAGGYGIQGLAAVFIDHIEGSYSGIVGLPLAQTAALLARAAIRLI